MKKILLLILSLNYIILADMIGGEIDIGFLFHKPTGNFDYKKNEINIIDDLHWNNEENHLFAIGYIEHPIPFLPNVRVAYNTIGYEGNGISTNNISFGNINLSEGRNITSTFDLKTLDLALYYEILDNYISIDLGLMVKYFELEISVKGISETETANIEIALPMLYGKTTFEIPSTDISLKAEGSFIGYENNMLLDLGFSARYTFYMGLGLEIGYKINQIKMQDFKDLDNADISFNGYYGAIIWDF